MLVATLCGFFSLLMLSLPAQSDVVLAGTQIGTGPDLTIVMFHGDEGNGGDPTSNFSFGMEIARRLPEATVHMLLRPGYRDPWGRVSPGNNYGRRDQYTLENASIIAANLARLKADTPLIAIGHSGGAAQLALALSLEENLADEAVLVSCPCDLELWQAINPDWPKDVLLRSTSATDVRAPQSTHVTLLVGGKDEITPSALSQSYIDHLIAAGVGPDLNIVTAGDHGGNRALSREWLKAIFSARNRLLK